MKKIFFLPLLTLIILMTGCSQKVIVRSVYEHPKYPTLKESLIYNIDQNFTYKRKAIKISEYKGFFIPVDDMTKVELYIKDLESGNKSKSKIIKNYNINYPKKFNSDRLISIKEEIIYE